MDLDPRQMQMLGEKHVLLCGLLAHLTLPKHHAFPSFICTLDIRKAQENPLENDSPTSAISLSFLPPSIRSYLCSDSARHSPRHYMSRQLSQAPPFLQLPASSPVLGGPLQSTAKPPEPFPDPPVHLLKAEFYIWKFINFFVCGC